MANQPIFKPWSSLRNSSSIYDTEDPLMQERAPASDQDIEFKTLPTGQKGYVVVPARERTSTETKEKGAKKETIFLTPDKIRESQRLAMEDPGYIEQARGLHDLEELVGRQMMPRDTQLDLSPIMAAYAPELLKGYQRPESARELQQRAFDAAMKLQKGREELSERLVDIQKLRQAGTTESLFDKLTKTYTEPEKVVPVGGMPIQKPTTGKEKKPDYSVDEIRKDANAIADKIDKAKFSTLKNSLNQLKKYVGDFNPEDEKEAPGVGVKGALKSLQPGSPDSAMRRIVKQVTRDYLSTNMTGVATDKDVADYYTMTGIDPFGSAKDLRNFANKLAMDAEGSLKAKVSSRSEEARQEYLKRRDALKEDMFSEYIYKPKKAAPTEEDISKMTKEELKAYLGGK